MCVSLRIIYARPYLLERRRARRRKTPPLPFPFLWVDLVSLIKSLNVFHHFQALASRTIRIYGTGTLETRSCSTPFRTMGMRQTFLIQRIGHQRLGFFCYFHNGSFTTPQLPTSHNSEGEKRPATPLWSEALALTQCDDMLQIYDNILRTSKKKGKYTM